MPYLLRFTGGASPAGYIAHPAALSGASTFDVEIDFVPRSISAGYAAVYSNNSGDLNNRHAMYVWGSSRCEIAFIIGGVRRVLNAPTGTFTAGTRYKVNATYDGSTFRILVNGSSVASVAASGAVGGAGGLVWIGANTTETRAAIDLYGYKITQNGTLIRNYDPSDTSTGTTLIDKVSGQDGTQAGTWPAGDGEWIFYSSGASNTVTVTATLPKITGSLTLNEINPSYVISVSGQLPKITGAVVLNEINPVFTVTVAGQLPKLTGSIALNQFANNRQVTVNGVLPKLTGAVTLNRIQPNNQASVSGQLPRITASITLRAPDSYPTAKPNDYTVSAYVSTDSIYTARLSESSTINAIISASSTFNARLN